VAASVAAPGRGSPGRGARNRPGETQNVTQKVLKARNYCLLYISAGEEFRGEAWEVDPKELAVRMGGGA